MADCRACGRDMRTADSCDEEDWVLNGATYKPIPYGSGACAAGGQGAARCPDCGVARGRYHHFGCALEACPRCHRQVLTCDCLDVLDAPERASAA